RSPRGFEHRQAGSISWLECNNRKLEATKLAVELQQLDRTLEDRAAEKMVGRDGIEPPTPGYSDLGVIETIDHHRSQLSIRWFRHHPDTANSRPRHGRPLDPQRLPGSPISVVLGEWRLYPAALNDAVSALA